MARARYEGYQDLRFDKYLNSFPTAKQEIDSALIYFSKSTDSLSILESGNIHNFIIPQYELDSLLAYLDETGDLRFLDRICVLINKALESLKTTWIRKPDGTRSPAWQDRPNWEQVGKRRWNRYFTQDTPNTPDRLYGTDLAEVEIWPWHGILANVLFALQNNQSKTSPTGLSYTSVFNALRDYLVNHFEPLWKYRKTRGPNQKAPSVLEIESKFQRSAISRVRYHRFMYHVLGRNADMVASVHFADFIEDEFVRGTLPNNQDKVIAFGIYNRKGLADIGESERLPWAFEPLGLTSITVGTYYHMNLINSSVFKTETLAQFGESIYNVYLRDSSVGMPSTDNGGGGYAGNLSEAERKYIFGRNQKWSAPYRVQNEDGVSKSRSNAATLLNASLLLVMRYSRTGTQREVEAFRGRFESLTDPKYVCDKIALAIYSLKANGWDRLLSPEKESSVIVVDNPGGGSEGGTSDSDGLSINNFYSTPPQLNAAGIVELSWDIQPSPDRVNISPIVGDVYGNSIAVSIQESTRFTITAYLGSETATSTLEIRVEDSDWIPDTPADEETGDYVDPNSHIVSLDEPTKVESLGIIVYSPNGAVIDRIVPGAGSAEVESARFTLEPNGASGGCKSGAVTVTRHLDCPTMSRVQILINGIPRFMGVMRKPPRVAVLRSSPTGAPSLRRAPILMSSTGEPIVPSDGVGYFEVNIEKYSKEFEESPGLPFEDEIDVYSGTVTYELEGLKSLADSTYLFNSEYINKTVHEIVSDIASQFCNKNGITYDTTLVEPEGYVTVKQDFDAQTVQTALDSLADLIGNIIWGVDPYGRFFFAHRRKITGANFYLDRDDVTMTDPDISGEKMVNAVMVEGSSFNETGKPIRRGWFTDSDSIAKYGRIEGFFQYPSTLSETGIFNTPTVALFERAKPIPTYTGVGWADSQKPHPPGVTPVDYSVGIRDDWNIRDNSNSTAATIPGDEMSSDGQSVTRVISLNGWGETLTLSFTPQYASKLILRQGLASGDNSENTAIFAPYDPAIYGASDDDDSDPTEEPLDTEMLGDTYYLITPLGQPISTSMGNNDYIEDLDLYNNGEKISSVRDAGRFVEFTFERQLVTELTLVIRSSPSNLPASKKWLIRNISILLEGKEDLERYAENMLALSREPVLNATLTFPKDRYVDPPWRVSVTDENALNFPYEVSEIDYDFQDGVSMSAKIGRGQINVENLNAIQKRASEASEKRSKMIEQELHRRIISMGQYIYNKDNNLPAVFEPWMDSEGYSAVQREEASISDRNVARDTIDEIMSRMAGE